MKMIKFNGKTMTVAEWSKETGLGLRTLRMRLERGWTVEEALTAPLDPRGRKRINRSTDLATAYRDIERMMDGMKLDLHKALAGLLEAQMKTSKAFEEAGKKALAQLEAVTRIPPGAVPNICRNAEDRSFPTAQETT